MRAIRIVRIGGVDRDILEYLSVAMPDNLGRDCVISDAFLDPRCAFDPKRRQYNSTQLLMKLLEIDTGAGGRALGVADVDLFIPVLTFVFGEAQLGGRVAVVSTHRLRQQFYGLREDRSLFYERCEKESVHEMGHAFGLSHCPSYSCVMHFSNSIEQVDLKPASFCDDCRARRRE
ncbi:MAG TPA: archaemetzincin family Zn-dependent metalloprotease [Blastocatellia bacterium]|nr:archaemetzincin family Zn-dependent metalloprotease [Blastocatellia bacterium]